MPSLEKPPHTPLPTTTVKWRFPSVHPEGHKYAAIALGITLLGTVLTKVLFWPLLAVVVWVLTFFRDPIRTTPKGDDLIVAPADGLVTMIADVPPPRELAGEGGLQWSPTWR